MLERLIISPQTAVCADPHYRNKAILPDATTLICLYSVCLFVFPFNPPPLSPKMLFIWSLYCVSWLLSWACSQMSECSRHPIYRELSQAQGEGKGAKIRLCLSFKPTFCEESVRMLCLFLLVSGSTRRQQCWWCVNIWIHCNVCDMTGAKFYRGMCEKVLRLQAACLLIWGRVFVGTEAKKKKRKNELFLCCSGITVWDVHKILWTETNWTFLNALVLM